MQTRRIPADLPDYQAGYRAGRREALREVIAIAQLEHRAAQDGIMEGMPGSAHAETAWADVLNRLTTELARLEETR